MILVDANLLIYAYDRTSPVHEPSRQWLTEVLNGPEYVGFSWSATLLTRDGDFSRFPGVRTVNPLALDR